MAVMTAEQAIARSVHHREIVHVDYDAHLVWWLIVLCEDHVDASGTQQFWGETDDGDEWRVHVRAQVRS